MAAPFSLVHGLVWLAQSEQTPPFTNNKKRDKRRMCGRGVNGLKALSSEILEENYGMSFIS